ncbi:MAG: UDP-N-acetylmuramate--L-alanine ligase [Gammaproteobacteria bacterium]|nr:UDP-N-acetylmuramate--L-alanine ligase [Gammaproteobacteria bacterium]
MMKLRNINRVQHIHCIGIGGSGMSGIAEVLLNQGYTVSGSDEKDSSTISSLREQGANIFLGHAASHVKGVDIVVVSSAIEKDNPELKAAHEKHIPVLPRAQMLGELMRLKHGITVAGTHGKTTTTSLVASLLTEAELDPTFVIGGVLTSAGTQARLGDSKYFVAEADESDASFLYLQPVMTIVTNIDFDHMQTYNDDIDCLKATFLSFLHRLPFFGLAVVCIDDPIIKEILHEIARPVITYGFDKSADIRAVEFKQVGTKCYFKVKRRNKPELLPVTLNLAGKHNVLNALAAMTIATECEVNDKTICQGLKNFQGVGRRFQIHGELTVKQGKVLLVDDYGHHPLEIAVTLQAMKDAWPGRRIVLAFQPHRYSRTKLLFDDFAQTLSEADVLLLLSVYAAGEKPIVGANSKALARNIRQRGKIEPIVVSELDGLAPILENVLQDGDILMLQGAGSIGTLASQLVEKYHM